jgi:hypothetical protein
MQYRGSFHVVAATILLTVASQSLYAYQVAPLGSQFEEKLTNEPTSNRARVAGKLGKLIKSPVHEEITQLAHACPTDVQDLPNVQQCASGDAGFANHFVIYGVRWNDLPPFALRKGEGKRCAKFLSATPACNVSQTLRFATQPECWYCLFQAAERTAATGRKIIGCPGKDRAKGERTITGNLMTRSHFGDLQFFHSMANQDGVEPVQTRSQVLEWLEFAWKVAIREISHDTLLRTVDISAIKERFGCSGWSVSDIYILGRKDRMLGNIDDVAFGSVLHTVQDSFAGGHVEREAPTAGEMCSPSLPLRRPGRIVEFHGYASQDGHLHDGKDLREALIEHSTLPYPGSIDVSKQMVEFYRIRAKWPEVKPYAECVFTLSPNSRVSSPGNDFRRP